jgi:hypothetical protein
MIASSKYQVVSSMQDSEVAKLNAFYFLHSTISVESYLKGAMK